MKFSFGAFSLVILTSHFEATRGVFWVGTRNFEPRSDDESDARACAPSPSFRATPAGGRLDIAYYLAYGGPHTWRIFSGIGFRTWNPPAPKGETLPLGHRGPLLVC
ncbi:hypothetical protein AVEN_97301-1 [Araneus ventricosus]|uniref:Secreted protein n=1 Tax=Araneus ventricosus TaxID=182803 RepID=A0A4Y2PTJ4_ARAVE|nr:hypothetical protein AVEN_97301-1 [Araneus ventricosus]